jgi:subfamily B ATP-binding cassette protein MsbA
MKLYLKVLAFIKPFWKHMILVVLLSFLYVFFNNLSLWISVDFVNELFAPTIVDGNSAAAPADSGTVAGDGKNPLDKMLVMKSQLDVYTKLKRTVKQLIIQPDRKQTLIVVCIVIFIAFLIKNIIHYSHRILLNFIEIRILVNIRNLLHQKLLNLPLSFFESRHSGEITSIVFNDVNAINNVMHNSFGNLIMQPVQIFANITILFMISVKLSLFTFIIIPLTAIVIVKVGQSVRRRSRRVYRQIADVVENFQESIMGIRIVKAFANERREAERFRSANYDYFKKHFREYKLRYLTSPINETMYVGILVFLLWYGGNLVYSGTGLTAEDFLRFLLYLFMIFQPLKELSGINNIIQSGMAAAERVYSILDSKQEIYDKPGAIEAQEFKQAIEYQSVTFRYNEDSEQVLTNINLNIKRGEMVAFVGHSGAGKTTIVNLLPRFYEITAGAITIDGQDIRNMTLHSLRGLMSIVTQETILFNDTIRNNIAYGLSQVSDQQIIEAAKVANAWEFIEKTEQGLDTHIGERGVRLSGGQKQRLSIARAILKNPPILILDEATSSLDTESERLVQEAIDNLLQSRTVLVIAHRLSTIRNATKIVVLHNGHIEGIGRHEELYQASPIYKNLYDNQLLSQKKSEQETN